MITDIIQVLVNLFDSIGDGLMGLALSPFVRMEKLAIDNKTISMLNWVFPLSEAVALLQAWCTSIISWYVFRYIKKHYKQMLAELTGTNGLLGPKGKSSTPDIL